MAVLPNGLETTELGRTAWREVQNQNFILLDNFIGNVRVTAENVSVDSSGFSGNLSPADDDVQKVAEKVDSLSVGGGTNITEDINLNFYGGTNTLTNLTSGIENTALGYQTSYLINTGSYNSSYGKFSLYSNKSGDSNCSYGRTNLYSCTGSNNVGIGRSSRFYATSGDNNTFLGHSSGLTLIGGGNYNGGYSNVTCVGSNTQISGSNQVQLGDSSTTTYAYGRVQDRSDKRDKREIEVLDADLAYKFINSITPSTYKFNYREDYFKKVEKEIKLKDGTIEKVETLERLENDGSKVRSRRHAGVIAQEIKEKSEILGFDFAGYQDHNLNGGEDVLSIGYQEFNAYYISCIQTQAKMINQLFDKVEDLENKIEILENTEI